MAIVTLPSNVHCKTDERVRGSEQAMGAKGVCVA